MTTSSDDDRSAPVLEVDNLSVTFSTEDGDVTAVRGLSYELRRGESLGIVGESGSGKSTTALALMGLLPKTAKVEGSARLLGEELLYRCDDEMSQLRGRKIAMIFQDPLTSLNPVYTVGTQIVEAITAHQKMSEGSARERAVELLTTVGIPDPRRRVDSYPHELSGGMRQRVVIAIAMANEPDVMVADEPTTALDVTVQAQVLEALQAARKATGAALVLITHDLGVIAGHADRVAVMYAGRVVESGPVRQVFYMPRMPYTIGLLASLPRLDESGYRRLTPIHGSPPSLLHLPQGCAFVPRCPLAAEVCNEVDPELVATDASSHQVACHRVAATEGSRPGEGFSADPAATSSPPAFVTAMRQPEDDDADAGPILAIDGLVKHFPVRSRGLIHRRTGDVHAVCGVSLDLNRHETLGLVGESGCGKTTVGRLLLGLVPATAGSVRFAGQELTALSRTKMRALRRDLQIVFQDPFASLDPRMTISEVVAEPLRIHDRYRRGGSEEVRTLLKLVGLNPEHGNRYAHEFSGGQRQRIGIARALALRPRVLVLDEPVSALDVSIQAGVVNLLDDLQEELGLSYLFISHDLSVVRHIADRVAVMYLGRIVETADTEQLFTRAAHPYTQALISAIPLPDPNKERHRQRVTLVGDVPNPVEPPSGCRFRTRCPTFADDLGDLERKRCVEEKPDLIDRGHGHPSACHYPATVDMSSLV